MFCDVPVAFGLSGCTLDRDVGARWARERMQPARPGALLKASRQMDDSVLANTQSSSATGGTP
jgi:hypothetical protein